jgi:N-acyl-D-amino-acid deacylase
MSEFDVLIRHGTLFDGTGRPGIRGDLAIRGDAIAEIGQLDKADATTIVDAAGLAVAPGFIDVHTHSDLMALIEPRHEAKLRQGVTTDLVAQDGFGYAPLNEKLLGYLRDYWGGISGSVDSAGIGPNTTVTAYLDRFHNRCSANIATMVPQGNVRFLVMGVENRPATPDEVRRQQRIVEECMEQGCCGVSTALTYAPNSYADTNELTEICKPLARYGGFYQPHLRSYGTRLRESIEETMAIARGANCGAQLTHFTAAFAANKGRAPEYLRQVDDARRQGLDITMDSYPYTAGQTGMHAMFPSWTQEKGPAEFKRMLTDRKARARMKADLEAGCDGMHFCPVDWSIFQIAAVETDCNKELIGMRIPAAARARGVSDPFEFVCDLLLEENCRVLILSFVHDEANIEKIIAHPAHMVGSDGIWIGDRPHPRGWGCHARYLALYTRERKVLRLEQTIYKMTGFPAWRLGLKKRGELRKGYFADVTVFDPARIQDTATYEQPRSFPRGVHRVFVNGVEVIRNGNHTGATPGRGLRRGS